MNDAFPAIKDMLIKVLNKEEVDDEYFLYQGLCESSHGKILGRGKGSDFYGFIGVAYVSLNLII